MATETAVDVVMPQMGVSVSEGTITKWLKQEGEQIEADEPLLEISTDKIDTEVPSPASGTVTQILVQEGETVDGRDEARADRRRGRRSRSAPEPAPEPEPEPAAAPSPQPTAEAQPPAPSPRRAWPCSSRPGTASFVSPVVARIAAEHGVDPNAGSRHRPRRPRDEAGHPRRSSNANFSRRLRRRLPPQHLLRLSP